MRKPSFALMALATERLSSAGAVITASVAGTATAGRVHSMSYMEAMSYPLVCSTTLNLIV